VKLCQSGEMTGISQNIEGLADVAILGWWLVGWVMYRWGESSQH
jgi:hypothetical protein